MSSRAYSAVHSAGRSRVRRNVVAASSRDSDALRRAAHDIRTPLAAVTQGIDALMQIDDSNDEGAQHLFNIVRRNVVLMGELLATSLDRSSRVTSASHARVDLGVLARDVVALLEPVLAARDQKATVVITGRSTFVMGDHGGLARVVLNIVDNASKYGPLGDDLVVRVARRKTSTVVSVHDHGPGIPPGERTAIFRAFYRTADARRSRVAGSGLGLSVVRELVAEHGGTVGVSCASGETRVWFALPNPKLGRQSA